MGLGAGNSYHPRRLPRHAEALCKVQEAWGCWFLQFLDMQFEDPPKNARAINNDNIAAVPKQIKDAWIAAVASKSRAAKSTLFNKWLAAGGDWTKRLDYKNTQIDSAIYPKM